MKQKRYQYVLLGLLLAIQLFAVVHFASFGGFADEFRFSQYDLELRLIEGIHSDQGVPLWQVRAFHNKLIGSVFDVFAAYLHFWSPGFLAGFLSLAGFLGIIAGWYYFLTRKKHLFVWILFWLVVLMPFVEIFSVLKDFPLPFRVVLTALPFLAWSLFGYIQVLQEKKLSVKWLILLLGVSLWYQLITTTATY